jgi:hypothetical protein
VKLALEQMGFSTPREKARRVTVLVGGRKTTVTIRESRLAKLADDVGSLSKARAVINEIAQSAPEGIPNRSAWIEERMAVFASGALQPAVQGDPTLRH